MDDGAQKENIMHASTRTLLAIAALMVSWASATATPIENSSLSPSGLGPIKIGMLLPEINLLLKHKITPLKIELRATPNCDYNKLADFPGVALLFINDTLVRIDLDTSTIRSTHGIAVGDRQVAAVRKMPHSKHEPLDHVPEGAAFVVEDQSRQNGVSYQFEHGKLVRMIAGNVKAIRYAEACM